MTRSSFSFSSLPLILHLTRPCSSLPVKYWESSAYLERNSHTDVPLVLARSWSYTCRLFSTRFVSAVNAINAEFLIDHEFEENDSVARIMAGVTNFWTSCLRKASWKMKRMMLSAWIFESSLSEDVLASFSRNSKVLFRSTGS